ncbi:MAG: hypothetical protein IJT32_02330 [Lachnospiraceae bacterium]|nr:hypothetical protein [Lachnospiraceae bacterium]
MQDILKEYGPAIITLIVTVALIGILSALIESETVKGAFESLVKNFYNLANSAAHIPATTGTGN